MLIRNNKNKTENDAFRRYSTYTSCWAASNCHIAPIVAIILLFGCRKKTSFEGILQMKPTMRVVFGSSIGTWDLPKNLRRRRVTNCRRLCCCRHEWGALTICSFLRARELFSLLTLDKIPFQMSFCLMCNLLRCFSSILTFELEWVSGGCAKMISWIWINDAHTFNFEWESAEKIASCYNYPENLLLQVCWEFAVHSKSNSNQSADNL